MYNVKKKRVYLCEIMQRNAFLLLSIFLSILVVYGGSGVNAYFYCCGDCRMAGLGAVVEHACCKTDHHNYHSCAVVHDESHDESHDCDQMISDFDGECGVDRIQFDWQSYQGSPIQLHPAVIHLDNNLFSYNGYTAGVDEPFSLSSCRYRQSQKPPDLSKEDYFSLLTILII